MKTRKGLTLLGIGTTSILIMAGCSQSTESPLLSFLESSDFEQPVVNLAEVYGNEWTDFALICPGATTSHIAEALDLEASQLPVFEGADQSVILYGDKDAEDRVVESDSFDPADVVLCDSTTPLASTFNSPTITFTKGAQGEWLAQTLDVGSGT